MSHDNNENNRKASSNRAEVFVWFTLIFPSDFSSSLVAMTTEIQSSSYWGNVKSLDFGNALPSPAFERRINAFVNEFDRPSFQPFAADQSY